MPSLSERALDDACALIFRRWRRFLPETEALDQAASFRQRCRVIAETLPTEAEFDATLAVIADAMVAA